MTIRRPYGSDCDLWAFPVRAGASTGLLNPAERDRAAGMKVAEVRDLFVTSRLVQREVLARYLGCAPAQVVVRRECTHCADPEHGRPFVEGGPPYSVTHSGGWVLVAVCGTGLVGVDLEVVGSVPGMVPARVCTPAERAVHDALPPEDRRSWFYRAWTRKEAAAKAVGRGLTIGLATVDTLADSTVAAGEMVWLRDLPAPPGYAASLATSQPVGTLSLFGSGEAA